MLGSHPSRPESIVFPQKIPSCPPPLPLPLRAAVVPFSYPSTPQAPQSPSPSPRRLRLYANDNSTRAVRQTALLPAVWLWERPSRREQARERERERERESTSDDTRQLRRQSLLSSGSHRLHQGEREGQNKVKKRKEKSNNKRGEKKPHTAVAEESQRQNKMEANHQTNEE